MPDSRFAAAQEGVLLAEAMPSRSAAEAKKARKQQSARRAKKCRVAEPGPELVGPDSGQVEEAARPTFGAERCR